MTEAEGMVVEATADEARAVTVRATNAGHTTVHIVDDPALPYILREGDGLLVLHGVNPPPEDTDFWGVHIPPSRPLEPGDHLLFTVSLDPLRLKDHYGADPEPTRLHGQVRVSCRVAWGDEPIVSSGPHAWSLTQLLRWQHWAATPDLTVDLG